MAQGSRRRWFGLRSGAVDGPTTTDPTAVDQEVAAAEYQPTAPPPVDLDAAAARLGHYVRVQVRTGVYDGPALRDLTVRAAVVEVGDTTAADELARRVLSEELDDWRADAERWPARTDCDRLDSAIDAMARAGLLTLPGLLDEASLAESLRIRSCEGGALVYFVSDIARAIETNSLRLSVLDSSGDPAGRHSPVARTAIDSLAACGLLGTTGPGEGHIDVPMVWRRHPVG